MAMHLHAWPLHVFIFFGPSYFRLFFRVLLFFLGGNFLLGEGEGVGGGASHPIHPPGSAPDTSTSVRDIPLSMFNQRLRKSLQFTTVNASSLRLSRLSFPRSF